VVVVIIGGGDGDVGGGDGDVGGGVDSGVAAFSLLSLLLLLLLL